MSFPRDYYLGPSDPKPLGYFSADGREFVITTPFLPRPWVNVLANPNFGAVVSHSGSGFTFVENSQLSVLTRWQQDLADDTSGKFLYLFEPSTGELWSCSPAPVWAPLDQYLCRHGLGYTVFEAEKNGLASRWTILVHPWEPVELWLVELENRTSRCRRLELTAYLEWNCGVAPSPRREFTKLFLENAFDAESGAVVAWAHMWDVSHQELGHWNQAYPFVAAFSGSLIPSHVQGDKGTFFGPGGNVRTPGALREPHWQGLFGRHYDPVAALRYVLVLRAGERTRLAFSLAAGTSREKALVRVRRFAQPQVVEAVLRETQAFWQDLLQPHYLETPDGMLNPVLNFWSRYQAIAGRLWARCGYYQQSGAYGFRDQLQDSQVWLTVEPGQCREQIKLHAAHQFADGSAYHWWHPLTEAGLPSKYSDDYLWLAFVTASYLKETGHWAVLDERVPFVDDPAPFPLIEHVRRAFRLASSRLSPRGLPLIGCGDWNDALSACGLKGRGESVWMAHFLALLAGEWSVIAEQVGLSPWAQELARLRQQLVEAVNTHGWDGAWYWRASLDDGRLIGSHTCSEGRIFLNAQTWAILAETAGPERQRTCWQAVKEHLLKPMGVLLLTPAYARPAPEIGYITRYAPGLRENGGVYTHAATWALAAAAKMKDAPAVEQLLHSLNPAIKNSRYYWAEPYVLPGNVDGPESPLAGRGGWTWYTGSAAWFHRVVAEWVCGLRPTWAGLLFDPCLPPSWKEVRGRRPYRQAQIHFKIVRDPSVTTTVVEVNGTILANGLLPARQAQGRLEVHVRIGEEP